MKNVRGSMLQELVLVTPLIVLVFYLSIISSIKVGIDKFSSIGEARLKYSGKRLGQP